MVETSSQTLGVLLDWFTDGYHAELIAGIEDEVKKWGINVIYLTGKKFRTTITMDKPYNLLYEIIGEGSFDGLIIPVTMMDYVSCDEYEKCLSRFGHTRIITLSFECKNIPSVTIDNREGLRFLLEHMIDKHGFRKLAYVHGPPHHPEAIVRFETYKKVIASRNVEFDEKKVFYGPFIKETGIRVVETFLGDYNWKIKEDIEVFICANDQIALGVIDELKNRGYSVPKDVAVTGFDNIEKGKSRIIPLTTVRQPIRDLGRAGVKLFVLNKKPEHLTTHFLPKGTCGCIFEEEDNSLEKETTPVSIGKDIRAFLLQGLRRIFLSAGPLDRDSSLPGEIVDLFLQPFSPSLLTEIKKKAIHLIYLWVSRWENPEGWCDALIFLEKNLPPRGEPGVRSGFFQFINKYVSGLSRRIEERNLINIIHIEQQLRRVNERLVASSDLDTISIYLSNSLQQIVGINICYIFLYDEPGNYQNHFKLLNNSKNPEKITVKQHKIFNDFSGIVNTLLSPGSPFSIIMNPLVVNQSILGFTLIAYTKETRMIYEGLGNHISLTIKHSFSIVENEKRGRELKSIQGRLVKSAHQAGMAQIAINLMHNIGNISNSALISIEELIRLLKAPALSRFRKANALLAKNLDNPAFFHSHLQGKKLAPYYLKLEDLMAAENEKLNLTLGKLEKKVYDIEMFIESQKQFAEGIFSYETVNLIDCLEDSLILEHSSMENRKIQLVKNYNTAEKYLIKCYRNKLLHALIHLLEEAGKRTESVTERSITITVKNQKNMIRLQIDCTGSGIARNDMKTIFSRDGEDSSESGGSALFFISNTLAEIHASIRADSEGPEHGAKFTLSFPRSVVKSSLEADF